ncbi:hypothetical protein COLSTE_01158 [Collinsella stercoris DSM 13279]|uniref:Uncharacterized protein n=1 Tax=Collinsella stercoris DSM 13279 TaxID=445975 RepID=B6GAQ8_9ACTN|nr:hypothetical protein COLSTE_01158 [Collinsella stercoris DSM 13279]
MQKGKRACWAMRRLHGNDRMLNGGGLRYTSTVHSQITTVRGQLHRSSTISA